MDEGPREQASGLDRWLAVLTRGGDRDEAYAAIVRLRAAGRDAEPGLLRILVDPAHHPGARARAADLLGDLGARSAVPALVETLTGSSVQLRWSAAQALGRIGDPSSIPALERVARDDDGELTPTPGLTIRVRDAATAALARLRGVK